MDGNTHVTPPPRLARNTNDAGAHPLLGVAPPPAVLDAGGVASVFWDAMRAQPIPTTMAALEASIKDTLNKIEEGLTPEYWGHLAIGCQLVSYAAGRVSRPRGLAGQNTPAGIAFRMNRSVERSALLTQCADLALAAGWGAEAFDKAATGGGKER